MTAVVDATATTSAVGVAPMNPLAPWWVRAAAFGVDTLPGFAVIAAMALTALTFPSGSGWWWSCVVVGSLAVLATAANRTLLPAIAGWSLGRALFGIAVVRAGRGGHSGGGRDGAGSGSGSADSVGPWRLLMRDLAHLLDTASLLVGWLWPLWDERRRTFADMIARTEVCQPKPAPPVWQPSKLRRMVAVTVVTAAAVCVLGATASYLAVFRHDQAVRQARAQITSLGPKLVEQMLTYTPASLQDDFTRAQSLVTDKYREQLVVQQQEVQKRSELLANQYWVINSAVLSVTPDRATMLLLMQGQRDEMEKPDQPDQPDKPGNQGKPGNGDKPGKPGTSGKKGRQHESQKAGKNDAQAEPPKARLITATVRVTFVRSGATRSAAPPGSSPWLVDDLTVLTKPLPAEPTGSVEPVEPAEGGS